MGDRTITLAAEKDILAARQAGRELARELGFGLADQTRLATAISELARNALQYAGGGDCCLTNLAEGQTSGVRVVVEDHGPGIPDLARALEQGFTTNRGLGAGLPGAKRLVDRFHIQSEPGHTVVTIEMQHRR